MTTEQQTEQPSSPEPSPASASLAPLLMQLLVAAVVLSVGSYAAYYLFVHVDKPERHQRPRQARVVSVMTVETAPYQIFIESMGTVSPARKSLLQMETTGILIRLSENIFPGNLIRKGDELLAIDDRAYKIKLAQRKAELAQRQTNVALEQGNAAVALKEFSLIGLEIKEEDRGLVLREPQLQAARAELLAAEQALADAELDLQRCVLRAPYDCIVLAKHVDLGENISVGTELIEVVGSDAFWIESLMSESDLRWLEQGEAGTTEVAIRHANAWGDKARTGTMLRVLPALEDGGRMARVLSVLNDPLSNTSDIKQALRIGAFVQTTFKGPHIKDAIVLPTTVVHDGDFVWLVKDGVLVIQKIDVLWRNASTVVVASGIERGDHVVSTPLNAVVDGMAVRIESTDKDAPAKAAVGEQP